MMTAPITVDADAAFVEAWTRLRPDAQSARRRPHLIQGLSQLILGSDSEHQRWDHAVVGLLRAAAMSGHHMVLFACPGCDCDIEVSLPIDELIAAQPPEVDRLRAPDTAAEVTVGDVVALAGMDPEAARAFAGQRWPDSLDHDFPIMAPAVVTRCPECGQDQEVVVDVIGLGWAAIEDTAMRVIDDVVALATAFGWNEPEVLAIPADRRRLYREMAGRRD